mmetsp:Transcript_5579/g.18993  ORF Transcript_5579/g.18993 Transcript_5579/m.18993 type:complete len:433 (-) Transcript_5579:214-1512(-)
MEELALVRCEVEAQVERLVGQVRRVVLDHPPRRGQQLLARGRVRRRLRLVLARRAVVVLVDVRVRVRRRAIDAVDDLERAGLAGLAVLDDDDLAPRAAVSRARRVDLGNLVVAEAVRDGDGDDLVALADGGRLLVDDEVRVRVGRRVGDLRGVERVLPPAVVDALVDVQVQEVVAHALQRELLHLARRASHLRELLGRVHDDVVESFPQRRDVVADVDGDLLDDGRHQELEGDVEVGPGVHDEDVGPTPRRDLHDRRGVDVRARPVDERDVLRVEAHRVLRDELRDRGVALGLRVAQHDVALEAELVAAAHPEVLGDGASVARGVVVDVQPRQVDARGDARLPVRVERGDGPRVVVGRRLRQDPELDEAELVHHGEVVLQRDLAPLALPREALEGVVQLHDVRLDLLLEELRDVGLLRVDEGVLHVADPRVR